MTKSNNMEIALPSEYNPKQTGIWLLKRQSSIASNKSQYPGIDPISFFNSKILYYQDV